MAAKHISAKQAALAILSRAGKPMPVQQLADEVLATPGVKLGGKTPKATIAAICYTSPLFKKVERGVVALADNAKASEPAKPKAKAKAKAKPRLAQRRKTEKVETEKTGVRVEA
jgi:hypothetical protein